MPVVPCPSCAVSLKLGDHLFGKAVKCPKCGEVFIVPAPESPPPLAAAILPPAPPPLDPPPFSSPPAAANDPLGYDAFMSQPPAPPTAPRTIEREPRRERRPSERDAPRARRPDYEDDDYGRPPRRRLPREDESDDPAARWQSARSGIRLVMIGAMIMFPVMAIWAVMIAFFTPGAFAGPGRRGNQDAMAVMNCGLAVFLFVGAILHFVGQVMCCWSPAPHSQRAVRFQIFFGGAIPVAAALFCIVGVLSADRRNQELAPIVGIAAGFVVAVLLIASWCYWVSYLKNVATHFGDSSLSTLCMVYLGFWAIALVAVFATSILSMNGNVNMVRMSSLAQLAGNTLVSGLYAVTLWRLNGLVGRALAARDL